MDGVGRGQKTAPELDRALHTMAGRRRQEECTGEGPLTFACRMRARRCRRMGSGGWAAADGCGKVEGWMERICGARLEVEAEGWVGRGRWAGVRRRRKTIPASGEERLPVVEEASLDMDTAPHFA